MTDRKPCRDCGTRVSVTSRSCPHCGIMNPVVQWTALPDGSHSEFRVPVTGMSAAWTAAAATARLQRPAKRGLGRYFSPIYDAEEAKDALDDSSGLFFLIAGLNVLAAVFLNPAFFLDAVVIAALALFLRLTKSRVAAGTLLVLMGLSFILKILTFAGLAGFGFAAGGVGGLIVAFFAVALAYRAMTATLLLARS